VSDRQQLACPTDNSARCAAPHAGEGLRHVKPAAVASRGVLVRHERRRVGPRVLEVGVNGQAVALALPVARHLHLRGRGALTPSAPGGCVGARFGPAAIRGTARRRPASTGTASLAGPAPRRGRARCSAQCSQCAQNARRCCPNRPHQRQSASTRRHQASTRATGAYGLGICHWLGPSPPLATGCRQSSPQQSSVRPPACQIAGTASPGR